MWDHTAEPMPWERRRFSHEPGAAAAEAALRDLELARRRLQEAVARASRSRKWWEEIQRRAAPASARRD